MDPNQPNVPSPPASPNPVPVPPPVPPQPAPQPQPQPAVQPPAPAPQPAPPKPPSVGGQRVIQPSAAMLQEMQSAKTAPKLAPATAAPPAPGVSQSPAPDASKVPTLTRPPEDVLAPDKLHPGIYVIVAFLIIGFILSLFDNNGILYVVVNFIQLALAFGLLLKKEVARKILVVISSILVILNIVVIIGLFSVQSEAKTKEAQTQAALSNALNNGANAQAVNSVRTELKNDQAKLNKTYTLAYIDEAIVILADGAMVFYLTRRSVKAVFK